MSCSPPSARGERRLKIVRVARDVFLEQGFAATSMSSIAARLGGSKTTLWSYFGSKADLFIAVTEDNIEQYFDPVEALLADHVDLQSTLEKVGTACLEACLAPTTIALARINIAEAERVPELGSLFCERGLGRGWTLIATFFQQAIDDGKINPACDPMIAAKHFIGMCQSNSYQKVMLGGEVVPDRSQLQLDAQAAAATILAAHHI